MKRQSCAIKLNYTYDKLGRLTSVQPKGGQEILYTYDAAGNQVSVMVKAEAAPVTAPSPAGATSIVSRPAPVDIFALSIQLENQRISMSDQLRLGSEADNDLTLPDKKASLHHAIIQRQGVVYKITDLNSDSGTYVNGKRITEPTLLKNGDIVLIGDTQLTISDQL